MAIVVGGRVKISLRYTFFGQRCQNVQWYRTDGAAFLTASASGVLEAYWNDIKSAWRAMIVTSPSFEFNELALEEENPTGAFGTYAVPLAERQGTRALGSLVDFLPQFVAASAKLTVATRVTRPGFKRLPGIMEGDSGAGEISATFVSLADAVAAKYSTPIILGAPVATGALIPVIVRLDPNTGAVSASQDVSGRIVSNIPTSQVSRKRGHGS